VPQLIARLPTGERRFELVKSVTSIGRDPQSDVRLDHARLELRHAHVLSDKGEHRIFVAPGAKLSINGKKRDAATLADGDLLDLGGLVLEFRLRSERTQPPVASTGPVPTPTTFPPAAFAPAAGVGGTPPAVAAQPPRPSVTPAAPPRPSITPGRSAAAVPARSSRPPPPLGGSPLNAPRDLQLEAFRRLHTFTERLAASPSFDALKETLVDLVVELTDADTGFLILLGERGSTEVIVARDRQRQDLPRQGARVSDSIVAEVVATRRPLLIQDALEDTLFGDSRSVINFKIRSVLALPVLRRDEVLGVLYLGSDRLTSAFSEDAFDVLLVFAAQAGLLIENALVVDGLRARNDALAVALEERAFGEIIGASAAMQEVFKTVSRLAPSDISVLVLGETGTGKELIAHELHRRSPRASGPFVAINVAAIPENLLESELFGHVRGAFTGADREHTGLFVAAKGGTVFLDEIGELPLALQPKLLRVLQERRAKPVGATQELDVDARVVAATNRDLESEVRAGRFREDLFFRLNVLQIDLPPLRARRDDIPILVQTFLEKFAREYKSEVVQLSPAALAKLLTFRFPGNVRQLENVIERCVALSRGGEVGVDALPREIRDLDEERQTPAPAVVSSAGSPAAFPSAGVDLERAVEALEVRLITQALETAGGVKTRAAELLGLSFRQFRYKFAKYADRLERIAKDES
jgi:transcriptional regulator with GAF, ATPase, and Fis domain